MHRPPPHDDWSLPKGKLDPGERHRDAAVREVHEETAIRGELGPRLGEIRYPLADGRRSACAGGRCARSDDDGFTPDDEIDERRWVPRGEVAELLTWATDRRVLDWFDVHVEHDPSDVGSVET